MNDPQPTGTALRLNERAPEHPASQSAPLHVAIIMDGNGRWAELRGWPRRVGHRYGAERVREIVSACPEFGVRWLTLYAFSTENWRRANDEVQALMSLFARYIRSEADALAQAGVRLRFIGDRSRLAPRLQELMRWIEHRTRANERFDLIVALNYGGRDEIVRATRKLAQAVRTTSLGPESIDEEVFAQALDTAGLPDPDLVIRTSGELRVSNFMLWQAAYAEFEFTPVLWPDFTPAHLQEILTQFRGRERRFGGATGGLR